MDKALGSDPRDWGFESLSIQGGIKFSIFGAELVSTI